VVLTLDPLQPGREFAQGTVGLSLEADELATQDLSANHKSLVPLMRMLGPGVLRLGGDSLDYSWWTSQDEHPPTWATSVVTPTDLVGLRKLLKVADWQVVLGVNLGHFDPSRAANEARVAERILGSRLLGFEIGNEPNHYGSQSKGFRPSSYSVGNYLEELGAYSTQMRAAVSNIRLYGPDLYSEAWLLAIASDKDTPFVALTEHYYPLSYSFAKGGCQGTPVPTAVELLSPQIRERESSALRILAQAGGMADREVRISETNNTGSCDASGGPATSPVFASALWSLDWTLRSAMAGVAGLNFHGYFGRCIPNAYSPICAPSYAAEARGQVTARPEYYGLLTARQLEGGRFIPVHIGGQSGEGSFTAYATKHPGGEVTVAVDNFATEGVTSLLLKVPGYDKATSELLIAPSLSATSGVSFGHALFNKVKARPPRGTRVPKVSGTFQLKLPPASAVVVTLRR
jgi:hypothetical protein